MFELKERLRWRPKLLFSFCLSKREFINCFLKFFVSLEILSSLFWLFQSLINLEPREWSTPYSRIVIYVAALVLLPKCVFLEWISEFSWSIDFRCFSECSFENHCASVDVCVLIEGISIRSLFHVLFNSPPPLNQSRELKEPFRTCHAYLYYPKVVLKNLSLNSVN